MKVHELIEQLKKMPQDAMVIVAGYEGGYNEVDEVEDKEIVLNVNTVWYYGSHEDADYCEGEKAQAVYLG